MSFDKTPRLDAAAQAAEIVLRLEVTREPDGSYMAHVETDHAVDGHHWSCSSDPQPTIVIAVGQCISIGWVNKQLGP